MSYKTQKKTEPPFPSLFQQTDSKLRMLSFPLSLVFICPTRPGVAVGPYGSNVDLGLAQARL